VLLAVERVVAAVGTPRRDTAEMVHPAGTAGLKQLAAALWKDTVEWELQADGRVVTLTARKPRVW